MSKAAEPETVVRAFELPLGGCEPEVWPLLRECWQHATDLANWCVFELARRDNPELPAHPGVKGKRLKGLYGLASEHFGLAMHCKKRHECWWLPASKSFSTICRDVERAYRDDRAAVVRYHKQALRTYRYPYPWPVHAQAWKSASLDAAGKPCITLTLPGGPVTLRLRGGPEFGRQMGLFRRVVSGDLPRLALSIRQQGCSTGCHRPHLVEKTPGGGQARPQRVMVKMVARLPVEEKKGGRVLTLCTDPQAFWVAELDGRPAWVLNADHVRRACQWLAAHESALQRYAQDSKAERRLDSRRLLQLQESRERCCQKHARRMSSWLHEAAANLVGFAVRQRVGEILYLDRDRGFAESFQWYKLHALLADKCKAAGIDFYSESSLTSSGVSVNFDDVTVGLEPTQEDEKWSRIARLREMGVSRMARSINRSGPHPDVSAP